jgi:hypothetical protein
MQMALPYLEPYFKSTKGEPDLQVDALHSSSHVRASCQKLTKVLQLGPQTAAADVLVVAAAAPLDLDTSLLAAVGPVPEFEQLYSQSFQSCPVCQLATGAVDIDNVTSWKTSLFRTRKLDDNSDVISAYLSARSTDLLTD